MACTGNMDKIVQEARVAVIKEAVRPMGSPYMEVLEQLILDASQAATWKEWALEAMDSHNICEKSALKEPFDPDVAREAIGECLSIQTWPTPRRNDSNNKET